MRSAVHGLLATDVEDMCSRLKYGSRQQRTATWQKLVSLEDGLDGDKVREQLRRTSFWLFAATLATFQ